MSTENKTHAAIRSITHRVTVKANGQSVSVSANPLEAMAEGFLTGLGAQVAFKRGMSKAGKALDSAWESTYEAQALAKASNVLKSALAFEDIATPLAIDTDEDTDESK